MNMKALFAALLLAASVSVVNAQVIIGGGGSGGAGGTGCIPAGSSGNALVDSGGGACNTDANASLTAGALTLGASGTAGSVKMGNATSGTVTLQPVAGALGTVTVSLPAATDTLVGKATTDTLTNKTLTSPTMTAPVLGAATATSINKMAITAPATSSTLAVADGKTATFSNSITFAGTDSTTQTFPSVSSTIAVAGIGATISSNGTTTSPTAAQINNSCPIYTVNATTATFNIPAASTIQASGGCVYISNPSVNSYTLTPNGTDNLVGPGHPSANTSITEPAGSLVLVTSDATTDFATNSVSNFSTNVWRAPQSCLPVALTISTTTFTPNGTSCNYEITLTGADTVANPSPSFAAGSEGTFKIIQDGTGGRTITWGSSYFAAGGVSTITLTSTASKFDLIAYHVDLAGNIWLVPSALNGSH